MESIQPYIENVMLALISLAAALLTAALLELRKRVLAWVESKTSREQREWLYRLAEEAFCFAEKAFEGTDGFRKRAAASGYLKKRLREEGIRLGEDELRAVNEKAVMDRKSL